MGGALMEKAIRVSRELGARRLLPGVYAGNEKSLAFYRRNGFVQIATRRFAVGNRDYQDSVLALALD
jgi:L-amino acid N-acyltransferase YncA